MSVYIITNTVSGHTLGEYEGETPEAALDAMAREAGYTDYADLETVQPTKPGEIVVDGNTYEVGDQVSAGEEEDHADGVVHAVDGDMVTVAWDDGSKTTQRWTALA
jgi:FKBP-type peptidyl-prolyl cis-trans isomerase 2